MCLILVATSVGRPCDALTTFMPAVLIAISYAVLGIKGGEGFEEQGSIS